MAWPTIPSQNAPDPDLLIFPSPHYPRVCLLLAGRRRVITPELVIPNLELAATAGAGAVSTDSPSDSANLESCGKLRGLEAAAFSFSISSGDATGALVSAQACA